MPTRDAVTTEVKEDLAKTTDHLLTDIHDEFLHEGRSDIDNIKHGLKRQASMFARIEKDNRKIQKWVIALTLISIVFGLIQTLSVLHVIK
jgi:hypothetical protein